mgnify:CR=1 FL=1
MNTTPLHLQTPLLESRPLSLAAQRTVWLKMEALQPPGSFKIRGIGHACQIHAQRGAKRFVSSSGGNAGMAVAYAGRVLNIPVTVVVPQTTTARAQELLRLENAVCTPHIGYVELDSYEMYFGAAFDNVVNFIKGTPTNIVNPGALQVRR